MKFNHERGDYEQKKRAYLVFVFENCSLEQFLKTQRTLENCFCSLNLRFFVFYVFFITKQNWESNEFSLFSMFSLFLRIENIF